MCIALSTSPYPVSPSTRTGRPAERLTCRMKKQTSSMVIMPRSGNPIEALMPAPERYKASNPAARACSAARPLCAPGICRISGRPSRARNRSTALARAGKRGSHFAHEAVHLLLDLAVRLESHVEIQDHFVEACGFNLLDGIGDAARAAEENGFLGQILGLHAAQPLHDVYEISIARRGGFRIPGKSGNHAFLVVADLASALRVLPGLAVGKVREIAAPEPSPRVAVFCAGLTIEIRDLLEPAIAHGGGERGP